MDVVEELLCWRPVVNRRLEILACQRQSVGERPPHHVGHVPTERVAGVNSSRRVKAGERFALVGDPRIANAWPGRLLLVRIEEVRHWLLHSNYAGFGSLCRAPEPGSSQLMGRGGRHARQHAGAWRRSSAGKLYPLASA